jgi:AP-2 complex subunit mu-1
MIKGDPEIEEIVVRIPVPKNTSKVKLHTQSRGSMGKMKYEAAQLCWVWRCKSMTSGTELTLSAEAELLQTAGGNAAWVRPPIHVSFSTRQALSGLRVKFFRVYEKTNYNPSKWIRYVTKTGKYQIRI